jgi:DNA-binding transcriptional regulator YiaG
MKRAQCSACGGDAEILRSTWNFTQSGLKCVVLDGIEIIRCGNCGNEDPIIPRINNLMKVLARAVIRKPYRLEGEEVRFLRKYLRMTQDEFSCLLHVDKTTLSKWENNEDPVGDQSDRLIRAIALALGEGLKRGQEEAIREFSRIQDLRRPVCIEVNVETMSFHYVAA